MHEHNCPCGACGRREAAWHRSESEAISQLANVFEAGLDDFVAEALDVACDTVGYDGEQDDDMKRAALHELIEVAVNTVLARTAETYRKGAAQTMLRLVAKQAGIVEALSDAEMWFVTATGERCGRIGAAAWNCPDEVARLLKRETGLDKIGRALDEIHVALGRDRPTRLDVAEFARREVEFSDSAHREFAALTQDVA